MKRNTLVAAFGIIVVSLIGVIGYNHYAWRFCYPFVTVSPDLSYKKMMVGNGRKAQKGDCVQMSLIIKKLTNGEEKVIVDSKTIAPFLLLNFNDLEWQHKPMAEAVAMVEEKQRIIFKLSAPYYAQCQEKDPEEVEKELKEISLTKEDKIMFDITVEKIMDKEALALYLAEQAQQQLEKDKAAITAYLREHNIQASSTESGLFYIIDQPSKDTPVEKNKKISVNYIGKLLDGTIFDTNIKDAVKANNFFDPEKNIEKFTPFQLELGKGSVIQGWEEGLLLLKKNEKARFFVPSALAYGEKGVEGVIPPNAVLLFEVEIVDVA